MEKYIIFYRSASGYDNVRVDAKSLSDAVSIADAFSLKSGAVILGVCPEFLLNCWYHE
nr:MAG TPA: Protein of unknown function (DUF2735) [Microviridae sp.]